MRLQKVLAGAGVASRRHAEAFLRQGRVSVNGEIARLGDSADPSLDVVTLDGVRISLETLVYWIVHKPVDVLTTVRDPHGRPTILELLPEVTARLFPVGRLDRDTEGLVLLTNDGPVAHALLHPSLGSEREYRVTVVGRLRRTRLRELEKGVPLDGTPTAPAKVGRPVYDPKSDTTTFTLILIEGRKRQIRRAMRALGHPVRRLVRVRMGPIRLGNLACGQARRLRSVEVRRLRDHAAAQVGKGLSPS